MNEWEEIHGFASPAEYKRFLAYIDEQVKSGLAEEVPCDARTDTIKTDGERWFKNLNTDKVWKLLVPDPGYFAGAWTAVEKAP